MNVQQVSDNGDNAVVTRLRKMIASGVATYTTPTTDHTFKKVFLNDDAIGQIFGDVILTVSMPNLSLSTRKVEVMSENVEAVYKNFQIFLRDVNEQQNTKVDVLFCADVNDERREQRTMQTRKNTPIQKPVYLLGEMQVREQYFGARLMSYVCKIMSASMIDLEKDRIPIPVYGVGICMWGGGDDQPLIKGDGLSSREMDIDSNTSKFTEIAGHNIFLGEVQKISQDDTRETINRRLDSSLSVLKRRVVKYFKKTELERDQVDLNDPVLLNKYFDDLALKEKIVYLFCQFIAFAHLMDEQHISDSLACLGNETITYDNKAFQVAEIFRKAYGIIKFNIGKNMSVEEIKNDYPDIWGLGEVFAAEGQKAGVDTAVNLLKIAVKDGSTPYDAINAFNAVDESMRVLVARKLLEERKALPSVLLNRATSIVNSSDEAKNVANSANSEADIGVVRERAL